VIEANHRTYPSHRLDMMQRCCPAALSHLATMALPLLSGHLGCYVCMTPCSCKLVAFTPMPSLSLCHVVAMRCGRSRLTNLCPHSLPLCPLVPCCQIGHGRVTITRFVASAVPSSGHPTPQLNLTLNCVQPNSNLEFPCCRAIKATIHVWGR